MVSTHIAGLYFAQLTNLFRTVLYHPLTPFFVLFCNVVATSDSNDFHTLKRVTEELEGLVEFSASIAKLQTLFKSFTELCEGIVPEKRQKTAKSTDDIESLRGYVQQPIIMAPQSQAASRTAEFTTMMAPSDSYSLIHTTSAPSLSPDNTFAFTADATSGALDPGWGLFDAHPTLDWLDADFSFFDSEQYLE